MGRCAVALFVIAVCSSCRGGDDRSHDSAFGALQERGQLEMGVDQYASAHVFEPLPDGGRIALQMKAADPTGESVIRDHMRDIARAFGSGDFAIPGRVHAIENVPGTATMRRLRADISYTPRDLDRGGEVRIKTGNREAIAAIHEFLAFQRQDHRAGMH
ncbi:MAG TPA: hypothetical protein VFS56_04560 [Gemmatimonadaceae bacterium]|nr:hypothetical protein [Gemmatimonadaceae bacterium]